MGRDRRGACRRRGRRRFLAPNSRSSSRAGRTDATPSGTRRRTSMARAYCARSTVPCSEGVALQVAEAREAALHIAEALGHVGVLTVEFFASRDGPVVNEIAPRVHNSGHWTIEGAVTSQFEQHIRAICGLPPGSTELVGRGATMENLIGDEVEPLARTGRGGRRSRPHLRQGRGASRPQDGPCHTRVPVGSPPLPNAAEPRLFPSRASVIRPISSCR